MSEFLRLAAAASQSLGAVKKAAQSVSTEATKATAGTFNFSSNSKEVINSLTKKIRLTKEPNTISYGFRK
jgi:hypothetical protein